MAFVSLGSTSTAEIAIRCLGTPLQAGLGMELLVHPPELTPAAASARRYPVFPARRRERSPPVCNLSNCPPRPWGQCCTFRTSCPRGRIRCARRRRATHQPEYQLPEFPSRATFPPGAVRERGHFLPVREAVPTRWYTRPRRGPSTPRPCRLLVPLQCHRGHTVCA